MDETYTLTGPTFTGQVTTSADETEDRISLDPSALRLIQHAAQMAQLGPWAISPEDAEQMILAGPRSRDREVSGEGQKIAIVPLVGPMTDRPTIFSDLFGGVSYRRTAQALRRLDDDPSVSTIVLDIDSPGGTVAGLDSLGRTISRLSTRTIAVSDSLMASAAYWIGSQADEVVATSGSTIGSVGVYTTHLDASKLLSRIGLKVTHISAGEGKVDGDSSQPLSDTAREHAQSIVDESYDTFVSRVVEGRSRAGVTLTAETVREAWTARVHSASKAEALGMVDRQAPDLESVLSEIATDMQSSAEARAMAQARARRRARLACGQKDSVV